MDVRLESRTARCLDRDPSARGADGHRKSDVTYYTVFAIDLASRRVEVLGSTPHPEALFMEQVVGTLTMAEGGGVDVPQVLNLRSRSEVERRRAALHVARLFRVSLIQLECEFSDSDRPARTKSHLRGGRA
jgi:hypothetical protein